MKDQGKNEKAKSSFCRRIDTETTLFHSRLLRVDASPMYVVVVGGWRVVVYMLSSIEHALIPLPEAKGRKARFIALSGRIGDTIE